MVRKGMTGKAITGKGMVARTDYDMEWWGRV